MSFRCGSQWLNFLRWGVLFVGLSTPLLQSSNSSLTWELPGKSKSIRSDLKGLNLASEQIQDGGKRSQEGRKRLKSEYFCFPTWFLKNGYGGSCGEGKGSGVSRIKKASSAFPQASLSAPTASPERGFSCNRGAQEHVCFTAGPHYVPRLLLRNHLQGRLNRARDGKKHMPHSRGHSQPASGTAVISTAWRAEGTELRRVPAGEAHTALASGTLERSARRHTSHSPCRRESSSPLTASKGGRRTAEGIPLSSEGSRAQRMESSPR